MARKSAAGTGPDLVDITAITAARRIRYDDLHAAIETIAHHRQVRLQPLARLLEAMPDTAQRKWATWRRKQRLDATTPEHFSDLLGAVFAFAEPVLDGSAEGLTWDTATTSWGAADMPS